MINIVNKEREKIGWSESQIKQYSMLLNKIVTPILDLCKEHQTGRVTEKVTDVTFDFSEGWFRISGMISLERNCPSCGLDSRRNSGENRKGNRFVTFLKRK